MIPKNTNGCILPYLMNYRPDPIGQRSFTVHPEDFPVYLVPEKAILQNPREAAAFQCQFEYLRYGALPRIHWQKEVNGIISDVEFAGR